MRRDSQCAVIAVQSFSIAALASEHDAEQIECGDVARPRPRKRLQPALGFRQIAGLQRRQRAPEILVAAAEWMWR